MVACNARLIVRRTDTVPPRVIATKAVRYHSTAAVLERAETYPEAVRFALGLGPAVPLEVEITEVDQAPAVNPLFPRVA